MAQLPDRPFDLSKLRISDADRERASEIVRHATGEGRLDLNEADSRLRAIYAATTYGELEAINDDLPAVVNRAGSAGGLRQAPESGLAVAIMSGFERKGAWRVPRRMTSIAFWGGGELDLREAIIDADEVRIRAFAVMGGIDIVLPENAEVHSSGFGIMGGFDHAADDCRKATGPRIIVTGFAFWGGVAVRKRPTDPELRRQREARREERRLRREERARLKAERRLLRYERRRLM